MYIKQPHPFQICSNFTTGWHYKRYTGTPAAGGHLWMTASPCIACPPPQTIPRQEAYLVM